MFDQVFESLRKASNSAIEMQQEMFKKWISLWPGVPAVPPGFGDPQKFQKKWVEVGGELLKKQRESMEVQFRAAMQNIEEAFRLGDVKDPEELRARTVELWQKMFDCLKKTYEAQAHEFQAAVAKWTELMMKGAA
jgi:hypothetical protein